MQNDPHPKARPVADAAAELPHDRDESPQPPHEDAQHRKNREPIAQARRDVESGIVDTERIGTPNDVPVQGEGGAKRR